MVTEAFRFRFQFLDGLAEDVRNASLIAEVCREEVPKLCSRLLISHETRPCSTHGMSTKKKKFKTPDIPGTTHFNT